MSDFKSYVDRAEAEKRRALQNELDQATAKRVAEELQVALTEQDRQQQLAVIRNTRQYQQLYVSAAASVCKETLIACTRRTQPPPITVVSGLFKRRKSVWPPYELAVHEVFQQLSMPGLAYGPTNVLVPYRLILEARLRYLSNNYRRRKDADPFHVYQEETVSLAFHVPANGEVPSYSLKRESWSGGADSGFWVIEYSPTYQSLEELLAEVARLLVNDPSALTRY
jgi:hypothetical protein